MRNALVMVVMSLFLSSMVFADRQLSPEEILGIYQHLTATPIEKWIQSGTIVATHREFRAAKTSDFNEVSSQIKKELAAFGADQNSIGSEELRKLQFDAIPFNVKYRLMNSYTMDTTVNVRIGSEKFFWQIDVTSRTDSVRPEIDLANNYMTDQFDLNGNGSRIFAWDGQQYSMYMRPINQAIIRDAGTNRTKPVVTGPLTAGCIPWGHGYYSYQSLSTAQSSAVESAVGCQKKITLNLTNDVTQQTLELDPERDFAVLAHKIVYNNRSMIANTTYGNFLMVAGRWIPTTVLIEKYKNQIDSKNLIESDLWDFTSVNAASPNSDSFKVSYENDAFVTYHSSISDKPIMYYHSKPDNAREVDSDAIVIENLSINSSNLKHNCATVAMQYALGRLGKNVSGQSLISQLVSDDSGATSMDRMKSLAKGLGLYAYAVKLDISTARNLKGCQVILFYPQQKHYVVLGDVDDNYARVIDLTNRKIYERYRLYEFGLNWTDGTALVLSNTPVEFADSLLIADSQVKMFIGSAGYSCTKLLQPWDVDFCVAVGGLCGGTYKEYEERWGCESSTSGTCPSGNYLRYSATLCLNDILNPGWCVGDGQWTLYYMRACA